MTRPTISVQGVSASMVATNGTLAIVSLLETPISYAPVVADLFNLHPQESTDFGDLGSLRLDAGIRHTSHGS